MRSSEPFSGRLRDQELRDTVRSIVTEYRLKSASAVAKAVSSTGVHLSASLAGSILESIGAYKDPDGYYTVGSGFTSPYTVLTDHEAILNEVRRALRAFVLDIRVHRDRLYFRSVPDSGPILQRWLGMLDWPEILMAYGGQHGAILDCIDGDAAVFVRSRLLGGRQAGRPNSWARPSLLTDATIEATGAWEREARDLNHSLALDGFEIAYPELWDEEAKRRLAQAESEKYSEAVEVNDGDS